MPVAQSLLMAPSKKKSKLLRVFILATLFLICSKTVYWMIGLMTSTNAAMTPEYKPAIPSFLRMLKPTAKALDFFDSPSIPFFTVRRV